MSAVKLSPFSGIVPRSGNRLLPDGSGVTASNVKLYSGELRALRNPKLVIKTNKIQPALSTFFARNGIAASAWFSWPFDVDVLRVPLDISVESRFVWTGDGTPKMATYTRAVLSGGNDYPSNFWELGIPNPQTKPSVAASGGVGLATTRFYVYTYFSALAEESAPSPVSTSVTGKVDDTWAITGMDEMPLNSGTGTAAFTTVTTFTNGSSARHWLRVGDEVVIGGATVKVLSTPTADSYTVAGDYHTETTWTRKTNWNTYSMKRRLYRTTGTQGKFQLVNDNVGTTYNDTLSDANIMGDELLSVGWNPPPVGLKGITAHASGALVGFVDNIIHFSEPFQPHAWVSAYQLSTAHEIVGIGVFGTEIGIGTKGTPYIASGNDPAAMTLLKIDGMYPCLSKRGLISLGDAIVYPSQQGMIQISNSGFSTVTGGLYTKDEWALLNPASMVATAANGMLYIAYTDKDSKGGIICINGNELTTSDIPASELYTDIETGILYITNINGVFEWDELSSQLATYTWKSKELFSYPPVNFGAAKIDFDNTVDFATSEALIALQAAINASNAIILLTGNAHGSINSNSLNSRYVNSSKLQRPIDAPTNQIIFTLRDRQGIVCSYVISDEKAFKLPAGYKSDVFSIEVISQSNIKEIRMAETMDSLRLL